MEKKSFFKNFLTIGAGMIIYMIVGIIGTPIITRLVDPVDYGRMSILTTYSNIGLMLCGLGLDQALLRFFYRDEGDYQRRLLHICTGIPLIVAVVAGIVVIGGYGPGFRWMTMTELILLECNLLAQVLSRFTLLLLRLSYHTKLYSTANIIQKSAYILLSVAMVILTDWSHFVILAVATILSTLLCAGTAVFATRDVWRLPKPDYHFPIKTRELLRYGFPIMLAGSINVVFNALDKLFIQHYCSDADVGVYASAMNLMAIFTVVQSSFNSIWMPAVVEHYEKDPEDKRFYRTGNTFISLLMLCFGATVVLFKDLFVLMLGSKYRAASMILPFLMFEPIMYTISESTATGIVVRKKTSYQVIVAGGACLTNFVGNWVLTPVMGPQGAAISTGVSYIVFFGLRTWLSNRVFPVDYQLPRFALALAAVFAFAVYGSNHAFAWHQLLMYLGVVGVILLAYRKDLGAVIETVRARLTGKKNRQ